MRTIVTYFLDHLSAGPRRSRSTPIAHIGPSVASVPEQDSVVNAFNELEQHLDGLRDAGRKLALVSESLRSTSREMKASVDRMTPARGELAVVTPTPEGDVVRTVVRRKHLQLLKTVA